MEDKYVFVNESLTINGGQGLFAKIDIPVGTNFAYFGGHVYTDKQWNNDTCASNLLFLQIFLYLR